MKKIIALFGMALVATLFLFSCQKSATKEGEAPANALTESEKAAGWELLFDGSTLDGWKRFNHDTIGPLWSVKEGAIMCDGRGLGEGTGPEGGPLMTKKQFSNFELA